MKKNSIFHLTLAAALALPFAFLQAAEEGGDKPEGAPKQGERRGPGGPGGERGPGGPGMQRPQMPTFEELDADKSGDVSEAEFIAYQVKQAEERAKAMFGRVDRDGDGKLTAEEMPKPRERDAEGGQRRMRDGEGGGPRGPRDGEGEGGGAKPKRPDVEA